jgi:hypothetical protein
MSAISMRGDPFGHLHWRAVCEVQKAAANHGNFGRVGVKRVPSSGTAGRRGFPTKARGEVTRSV